MAMAVNDEMSRRFLPWGLPLRSGSGYRVTPRPNEPVYVTGAYLLDSESAVGQGAVDACVHIDTRNVLSALLSAENPRVELQTPVPLEMDKECCFHVVPHGGDSDAEPDRDDDADTGLDVDADADDDADADAVIVMFEGFLVTPQPLDTEEEEDDDDVGEEETGRDDDDEYEEKEEETDGEVAQDVAWASSAGGNAKELGQVVAITMAFLGILLSVSMLAFLGLIM
ncbi:hypothetical protein CFC21_104583 [Triticum aestivum]|uniref:Nucleoplasmin-like domain-containing protein n=2 Tax=Triticum aestivum TaxID=4565 RepID=A0A9R1MAB2_WHEAT|nr:hypothetical protein CFC21_104582 [Triticum aestivum]KAF7103611.1 hypothetical protein CFC21_104583 [Triticum aestivum]